VLPVTAAEMDYKLAHGVDGLLERMEKRDDDIYGPIDPRHKSTV
jgi:hypothetical protein